MKCEAICRDCYWCEYCDNHQEYFCRNIDSNHFGEFVEKYNGCLEFEPNEELYEEQGEELLYVHYKFC